MGDKATANIPSSSIDPSGSTKKVSRNIVLLRYKIKAVEYTRDEKGKPTAKNAKFQEGDLFLLLPQTITNYFNIPTWTPPDNTGSPQQVAPKLKKRAAYTYERAADPQGNNKMAIAVREYYYESNDGGVRSLLSLSRKSAILPLIGKTTAKGNTRSTSIGFPPFFNNLMISQALGTMIKANFPPYWKTKAGGKHSIFWGSGNAPIAPADTGAWLVTAPTTGEGDVDKTLISQGGGQTSADNT